MNQSFADKPIGHSADGGNESAQASQLVADRRAAASSTHLLVLTRKTPEQHHQLELDISRGNVPDKYFPRMYLTQEVRKSDGTVSTEPVSFPAGRIAVLALLAIVTFVVIFLGLELFTGNTVVSLLGATLAVPVGVYAWFRLIVFRR